MFKFRVDENKRQEKLKQKALENQREYTYKKMVTYEKIHKKERKIAPKDSFISLQHINKIYDNLASKLKLVF